jgi:adenylosuccinate lyase
MQLQPLTAISPIDGRYRNQLQHLDQYFSEFALIKYRVKVEVEYFLFLSQNKFFKISASLKKELLNIEKDFSIEDAEKIKATERITNHDVKAVEYFLKEKLKDSKAADLMEWIHF